MALATAVGSSFFNNLQYWLRGWLQFEIGNPGPFELEEHDAIYNVPGVEDVHDDDGDQYDRAYEAACLSRIIP